jgi:hypothetical protein
MFPQIFGEKNVNVNGNEDIISYIENSGLGVIFQKGFYTKIMESIELNYKEKRLFDWYVYETQGIALIQIIIEYYNIENKIYILGLQYQNNTLKINYLNKSIDDYWNSSKDEKGFLVGAKAFEEYFNWTSPSFSDSQLSRFCC